MSRPRTRPIYLFTLIIERQNVAGGWDVVSKENMSGIYSARKKAAQDAYRTAYQQDKLEEYRALAFAKLPFNAPPHEFLDRRYSIKARPR